jgi:hypothetical protein
LTLKAYRGLDAVLLAFDVEESLIEQLAGFAVQYAAPGEGEEPCRWDVHGAPLYRRSLIPAAGAAIADYADEFL